ncbi:hypothetical protein PJ232_21200, partial [Escherichia coli]
MATNDFKPFATGSGANVLSQADYDALSARTTGFLSGKASSAQVNKALRQASTIAAVVAQFISDNSGDDTLDNGNLPTLLASLESALLKSSPGRLQNIVSFTANGTYTPSPGTKHVKVIVTGGGGGGGGCQGTSGSESVSGGGGGAGGTAIGYFAVTESSYAVTVGAGGSAGVGAVQGGTGGTSIINGISGLGGDGGQKSGITTLAGGKGGISIGGSVNLPGGYGTDGQNGSLIIPGNGGSSYWGGGGRKADVSSSIQAVILIVVTDV